MCWLECTFCSDSPSSVITRRQISFRLAVRLFLQRCKQARSCFVGTLFFQATPPPTPPETLPHIEWNNKFKAAVNFQIFTVSTSNFTYKTGPAAIKERKRKKNSECSRVKDQKTNKQTQKDNMWLDFSSRSCNLFHKKNVTLHRSSSFHIPARFVFSRQHIIFGLMRRLSRDFVENDGNNWNLGSQCLPSHLISGGGQHHKLHYLARLCPFLTRRPLRGSEAHVNVSLSLILLSAGSGFKLKCKLPP